MLTVASYNKCSAFPCVLWGGYNVVYFNYLEHSKRGGPPVGYRAFALYALQCGSTGQSLFNK